MKKSKETTITSASKDVKDLARVVEQLAMSVAKGFDETEKSFQESERRSNTRFETVLREMSRMNDDIRDIKTAMGPFARLMGSQDREIQILKTRVSKLEAKAR